MQNFIPYEKLSKKVQKAQDSKKRATWGALNPVTRKPANPKAYNRKKARKWSENSMTVPFSFETACKKLHSRVSQYLRFILGVRMDVATSRSGAIPLVIIRILHALQK